MTAETVAEEIAENVTEEVAETEIFTMKMAETKEVVKSVQNFQNFIPRGVPTQNVKKHGLN